MRKSKNKFFEESREVREGLRIKILERARKNSDLSEKNFASLIEKNIVGKYNK